MRNKESLIETHQKLKDSLDVIVKIDWRQVLNVVVRDLISKYKYCVDTKSNNQHAFKEVLMYYLVEEDFEKYVTNNKKIEP